MGSVFGYEVESEIPLRRLRAGHGARGTIAVRQVEMEALDESVTITAVDHLELPTGAISTFVIGRGSGRTTCACSHTGLFRLDPQEMLIEVAPLGEHEMWEHRLLSVIVPILLAGVGQVALHGGAVDIGARAAIFCGPAMRGKSTLALTFAELGRGVLSEDGVVLEEREDGWIAWPAASGVRIRTQGEEGKPAKVLGALPGPEAEPIPVAAVVVLDERGGDGQPEELAATDALLALAPSLMHSGGAEGVRPAFAGLARVLGDVPAFTVSLPDDMAKLPAAAMDLASALATEARPRA